MRLLLVRHGQTAWNNDGRVQGHTDIPLDPTGLDQVLKLGLSFIDYPVDRILTSDLIRSSETARAISEATKAPLEFRKDLRERCFGEWEGVPFQMVNAKLQERAQKENRSPQQIRPPGGESFEDVWNRLDPIHQMLKTSDDTIVIVSHGGALSLLVAKLIKGTLDTSRAFRFANTGVTELERRAEGLFMIVRLSDTSHLAAERTLIGSRNGVAR